jgi:hypothetical protein
MGIAVTRRVSRSLMNILVAYAKIPMSFFNLYRQRRPRASYSLAIACVMSTIVIINLWTLLLMVSMIDRELITEGPRVDGVELAGVLMGILLLEIGFVYFVQTKVARDAAFAERVRNAPPLVSICYTLVSIALLAALAVLAI